MKPRTTTDTKQQILDVAERHFASFGFGGTSLRGIIKDARVNIAAVAYHFGTKEDLFNAVVDRFAVPVVAEQLASLEAANDLRAILESFYLPPLRLVKSKGKKGQELALFLGRMQTEPEPVFSIVDKHFASCRNRYVDALRQQLPTASEADLHWNFEFMLSLIVAFLTRQSEIRKRYDDPHDWEPEQAAERMIRFCLSGMHK